MKLYMNLIAINLKSQMQYKLSFFLTIIGQLITAFTFFWGVQFIFSKVEDIDSFAYEEVLLCFAVVMLAFSIGELFGGGLAVFPHLMSNGEFDRALVRPKSVIIQVLVPHMDFTRLGLVIQAIIILGLAISSDKLTWTWQKILALCLMIVCGSSVFFGLFLLKASCSFFTVQSLNFMNIFTYGARQFGKYPFTVYGKSVLITLTFVIPLALFQYYPLLFIIDREPRVIYIFFPLLSLLVLIPCYALFRLGLHKYKSIGS